ncbi:hypothetical protein GGX14DRAFT_404146 [Mycena pura]|uniref:Uncharacterized protein n=1 Tax=Mycena pura TaxID=153505 RepID=A0AAD6UUJ6_9AGAR|nr:hypothetical protein GGX14DRAFT_404146 [Mycena pura]
MQLLQTRGNFDVSGVVRIAPSDINLSGNMMSAIQSVKAVAEININGPAMTRGSPIAANRGLATCSNSDGTSSKTAWLWGAYKDRTYSTASGCTLTYDQWNITVQDATTDTEVTITDLDKVKNLYY